MLKILLLSLSRQYTVDGQYIPSLFIEPEVRHDKTSYTLFFSLKKKNKINKHRIPSDSLSVRFSWRTQKQQREQNSIFFMCRDLKTSIYLDDNASINSVPV